MPVLKSIDRRLVRRLPAFSPVALRLLSVLSDERASFKEIARIIELDPALTGKVLQLANSGLYGRQFEVCSVLHAVAMLGIGTLSQITMTAALWRGLPRRTTPFVRDWWRHSIASALIARHSSMDLRTDFAYAAALLHGIGQLAMIEDAPQDYPNLVEHAYADRLDLSCAEREVFGIDHASLAGLILESWGLPQKLCEAAAQHHEASTGMRLLLAVQTACTGAEYAGFGRCGRHERLAADGPGPLEELLAGDYLMEKLVAEVNQIECFLA
jgi:HD-like signal output (HDOD) protein